MAFSGAERPQPTGVCPRCGGPAPEWERYPRMLCRGCVEVATDLAGRPVAMYNVSMSGGFEARHRDDETVCEQVTREGRVLIDGAVHAAGEHRFGGIVVEPL